MASAGQYIAIVLAASRGPDDPMARAFDVEHKCLIEIDGTPMIARILETLVTCPWIAKVVIAIENRDVLKGQADVWRLLRKSNVTICNSLPTASGSVAAAIDQSGAAFPYLLVTADHALLSHDMLDHVCRAGEAMNGDIAVALARAEIIEARYPQTRRTFLRFSNGRFSGCNLFVMKTPAAHKALAFWQNIEAHRKTPWRLARAFGFRALFAYLTGRLSLAQAMERASNVLGLKAVAIDIPIAEAAIDVDKPDDLALVRKIIQGERKRRRSS